LPLVGGLLVVVLVALLDYLTGPQLSFSLFYLAPVLGCAWWGGFPQGVLVALAGAVAWHAVDYVENPDQAPVIRLWNDVVLFSTLTLASSLAARLHAGMRRERHLARTDPLTGAANARTFYEAVVAEADRARRTGRPLTLAYLDLDDFKQLNDRQGHAAGDEALLEVVAVLHRSLRGPDLLARLGGDEFGLLLPETDGVGATTLLARLQELLLEAMNRRRWPVTFSIGSVTYLRLFEDVDRMIQQIDTLMYRAKRNGKGRIEHIVIRDERDLPSDGRREADRRATIRVLCDRAARVRRMGQDEDSEEFAVLRDISTCGIGLHLEKAFPPNTVIVVESLAPGSRTLLARVVHVTPADGGWLHGCVLSGRLDSSGMGGWVTSDMPEVAS